MGEDSELERMFVVTKEALLGNSSMGQEKLCGVGG
jgi:hypothetical protein